MAKFINYSEAHLTVKFYMYMDRKIFIQVTPIDSWDSWTYKILAEDAMSPFFEMEKSGCEYESYWSALNHAVNYLVHSNI